MIGINKSLYDHYLANTEKYEIYDQVLVQKFIGFGAGTENYEDRKTLAILLVQKIFEPHSKQMMGNYLETLAHVESRVKDLYYNARDHVIHAVITYLLGIYLSDLLSLEIHTFEWKLAALLHDIGYPIEQGFGRPVEEEINKFIELNEVDSPRVDFNRKLRNLERLTGNRNSCTLITSTLHKWGFSLSTSQFLKKAPKPRLDHGAASALIVTKCLDCMYAKHNPKRSAFKSESKRFWSYKNFTTYIINAAGSIFLHNLELSTVGRSFNKNEHPLAFLLKLSDELQDWERINQDEQYFSASHYAIEFDETSNIFKVYAPGERVMRLKSALMAFEDIEFQVLQIATSLECQPAATAVSADAPPLAP